MSDSSFDDFALAASTYDPEKFYVGSTNTKGFQASIRVNIPPEVHAEIGALVASRDFPMYRTNQDFYRDAIVHHLKRRQDAASSGMNLRMGAVAAGMISESNSEMLIHLAASKARRLAALAQVRASLTDNPFAREMLPNLYEAMTQEPDGAVQKEYQRLIDDLNAD